MGAFSDLRLGMRRVLLLAAVLALTLAGVARAETFSTSIPFTATVTSCTGEPVPLEGVQHFKITLQGGLFHVEQNLRDVKGVGTLSGAKYVASNTESALFNSIPPGSTLNIEHTNHLVRQGEDGTLVVGDDFKVKTRTQVVINANGVPTVTKFDTTTEPCQ